MRTAEAILLFWILPELWYTGMPLPFLFLPVISFVAFRRHLQVESTLTTGSF
jgi:hypothetical protein